MTDTQRLEEIIRNPHTETVWLNHGKECVEAYAWRKPLPFNDDPNKIAQAISKEFVSKERVRICKCSQDVAKTVKVFNNDFFQCPRCGGLLPNADQLLKEGEK